jgi:hypothetical protein
MEETRGVIMVGCMRVEGRMLVHDDGDTKTKVYEEYMLPNDVRLDAMLFSLVATSRPGCVCDVVCMDMLLALDGPSIAATSALLSSCSWTTNARPVTVYRGRGKTCIRTAPVVPGAQLAPGWIVRGSPDGQQADVGMLTHIGSDVFGRRVASVVWFGARGVQVGVALHDLLPSIAPTPCMLACFSSQGPPAGATQP